MSTEKLAREWAEYYRDNFPEFHEETRAAALVEGAKAAVEFILNNTTPPTMANVKWDDAEHHLAGATLQEVRTSKDVVMFWPDSEEPDEAIVTSFGRFSIWRGNLTPNGKRYKLVEIVHKQTLTTEEDYRNAPRGTVVGRDDGCAMKGRAVWFATGRFNSISNEEIADCYGPLKVLRWGDGE